MFIRSGYRAQTRSSLRTDGHHLASGVVAGGGNCRATGRTEARGARLAYELGGGRPIETDRVLLNVAPAVRTDRLAEPLEHQLPVCHPDRGRPAGIHDAVALADIGERLWPGAGDLVKLEPLGDRHREQPAGLQVAPGPLEEAGAARGPAEQLNRLHRDQAHGE